MIYTFKIRSLAIQRRYYLHDGWQIKILPGELSRFVGRLVPGDVDHVAMYTGPGGRCVEASSRGVTILDLPNFDLARGTHDRPTRDGVGYILWHRFSTGGHNSLKKREFHMRTSVAKYCTAQVGKPYNLNFLNAETEDAFYCSQLIYKAYQQVGINLNTGLSIEQLPGTNAIIYPQEIWGECMHRLSGNGKFETINDPS